MENWTLQRIGFNEPVFSLQNHIPVIKIGRANEVHKQCLGKKIPFFDFFAVSKRYSPRSMSLVKIILLDTVNS